MLTQSEEKALEEYILKMQEYAYPLSMDQLRLKVAEMVQERVTPFRDGIPGNGWIKWFRKRHPNLTLRNSEGLEFSRTRGLCPENERSFYNNLKQLYSKENYPPERIWNSDETGAQVGRNGGGRVWAQKGSRSVHKVLPNEREWITNLTCVNAAGDHIPGFYIFRGKRLRSNYVLHCEDGATMAMQTKAWMTATLFSHWISHVIRCLQSKGGISQGRRHLLIFDGHNSHVTLEVVHKCREVGLDLVTLPSHTSHRLQPLDVGVFAPFKRYFKRYRDAWSVSNKGKRASKQTLAMWVSRASECALTRSNTTAGFRTTGIYPLNSEAVNVHMGPARQFGTRSTPVQQGGSVQQGPSMLCADENESDHSADDNESGSKGGSLATEDLLLQEMHGELVPDSQPPPIQHFYVQAGTKAPASSDNESSGLEAPDQGVPTASESDPLAVSLAIAALLALPEIASPPSRRRAAQEALIDYSQSLLLTSEEYVLAMEKKGRRREEARV